MKVPLLSLLKRDLRDVGHPFARLGLAELPIDDLAELAAQTGDRLLEGLAERGQALVAGRLDRPEARARALELETELGLRLVKDE